MMHTVQVVISIIYLVVVFWLSLYGFNALWLLILYLRHRRQEAPHGQFEAWPAVTVQVPLYNEQYVVERVIDAVAAFDYPAEALQIQVLDDSTDETTALALARVDYHRSRGVDITLIHRENRQGYKAGALRSAMASARGEFMAIFDADFVPEPDFLQRTMPAFAGRPEVGFVQTRWTYLNDQHSILTGALAMAGDAHFIIEQVARSRSGLLMNFNGSAGVWRRACIETSGGWQDDTLTEDLDMSYRAQMVGWRTIFLPEVTVASELPEHVALNKQQQFRWAKGGAQTLRKLFWPLVRSRLSYFQKIGALLHLTMYFSHLLMLLFLITWLPMVLYANGLHTMPLAFLSLSTMGLPLVTITGQAVLHRDWPRRLIYLPLLLCLGCGLALSNAFAVLQGLSGVRSEFVRTPKLRSGHSSMLALPATYQTRVNATVVGETALAAFTVFLMDKALEIIGYGAIPFLLLYMLGFVYVAGGSLRIAPQRALALLRAPFDIVLK